MAIAALAWIFQTQLIYPAPQQVAPIPSGYQEAILKTDDGLSLRSAFRAPQAELPVVLFFHGNGDNLTGSATAMSSLAEAGYGIMLVEYRGYGGNPGEPSEQGFYRDGRAAFAWLGGNGYTSADIVLAGNSIGSGTAVQMASEFNARGLILISPLTSVPDVAAKTAPFLPVRLLVKDRFANDEKIGGLVLPILIQHGTTDQMVPLTHSHRLAELAKSAELEEFAGAGHELAYLAQPQAAQIRWLASLQN